MHKLFQFRHEYLSFSIKSCNKNPKFLLPISHLHSFSKTRDLDFLLGEVEVLDSSKPASQKKQLPSKTNEPSDDSQPSERMESTVQISHPWPEWVDLMELLLRRGYFEADGNPVGNKELGSKDVGCIRTACLNFARDRSGLIRYFSRKDIGVIAGCGCPSIDRKVVNSGKRLRAHVGINEGHVCSSCNLRGDCERAYVKAREDEGGRAVDVMRILLTYGLDYGSCTVENKPCQKNKMVKESVRRLLKELVGLSNDELDSDLPNGKPLKRGLPLQNNSSTQEKDPINVSMKPGDWLCPKCNFLNFARKVRCLRCDGLSQERLKHLCEDQDQLPLKKGDWICASVRILRFIGIRLLEALLYHVCNAKRDLQSGSLILGSGNVNRATTSISEETWYA
uniref:RanBP2-type domain-containing protein n=1 Tax=Salix viminalis TaxID=40686 RepID=A0A6N2M5N4_SALVM